MHSYISIIACLVPCELRVRVIPRKLVANKIMRKSPNIMALSNPITISWLNRAVEAYTHLPSFQQQCATTTTTANSRELGEPTSSLFVNTSNHIVAVFSWCMCASMRACVSVCAHMCMVYLPMYVRTIDTNVQTYEHTLAARTSST